MKKARINIPTPLLPAEKFFVEKSFELLSEETIDTYRLRLNNPKSALEELNFLITAFFENNISEDYPHNLCKEAIDLLKLDEELEFRQITKPYFLQLLDRKDLKKIHHALKVLLEDNKNYLSKLLICIETEIENLNATAIAHINQLKKLNKLTPFLFVEIRRKGFNKTYLHRTIRAIFASANGGDSFQNRFNGLKTLLNREKEVFKIYIAFIITEKTKRYIDKNPIQLKTLRKHKLLKYAEGINQDFIDFLSENDLNYLYYIEVKELDYYSATIEARKILQKCLDFSFLGDDKNEIAISGHCFVIGTIDPTKGKRQNLHYSLDGDLKGNFKTFLEITHKLTTLETKNIDQASLDKLHAGLRYLRLGTQSSSPEQKLIHYWIALEYIYSTSNGAGNKTTRLKEFFKNIHAYTYARRLFYDIHTSIKSFHLHTTASLFDPVHLDYLTSSITSTELSVTNPTFPLLNFRLYTLNDRYKNKKSIDKELKRHRDNLERNIIRIYRVRNQIIHNAAADSLRDDIFELAAHLKYYLVFTLNGFIDFIINYPQDINDDKRIGIDDYFNIITMKLESLLSKDDLNVKDFLSLNSPIEYLK